MDRIERIGDDEFGPAARIPAIRRVKRPREDEAGDEGRRRPRDDDRRAPAPAPPPPDDGLPHVDVRA